MFDRENRFGVDAVDIYHGQFLAVLRVFEPASLSVDTVASKNGIVHIAGASHADEGYSDGQTYSVCSTPSTHCKTAF